MQPSPITEDKKPTLPKQQTSLIIPITPTDATTSKKEEPKFNYDDHNKTADTIKSEIYKKGNTQNKFRITEEALAQTSPIAKEKDKENIEAQPEILTVQPIKIIKEDKSKEEAKQNEEEKKIEHKPAKQEQHKIELESGLMRNIENSNEIEGDNEEIDKHLIKRNSLNFQTRKQLKRKEKEERLNDIDLHYLLEVERLKQNTLVDTMMKFSNNCMEIVKASITNNVLLLIRILNSRLC